MQRSPALQRQRLLVPPDRFQPPHTDPAWRERPQLLARLDSALRSRLTLVCAPAGFGKTVLLAQAVRQRREAVAWLSIDAQDNSLWSLLQSLLTSIELAVPASCPHSRALLAASELPAPATLAGVLAGELLLLTDDLLVVLDDYQNIDDPLIDEFFVQVLGYLPASVHVVVLSRVDPAWPLSRWRASGQLSELRARDLQWSLEETAELLATVHGSAIDAELLALLHRRTEGWIAGLHLAQLSLREQADPALLLRTLQGTPHSIMDYLLDQVFNRQPAATQRFLISSAILERFCAPLCAALFVESNQHSSTILAQIERRGLFLTPLDTQSLWFRYHQLFRDLLIQKLQLAIGSGGIAELYRRASAWCLQQDLLDEAFRYALLAEDLHAAADCVDQLFHIVMSSGQLGPQLERWLDQLPPQLIEQRPSTSLIASFYRIQSWDLAQSTRQLTRAEALLNGDTSLEPARRNFCRALLARNRTMLAWASGDFEQLVLQARIALDLLPSSYLLIRSDMLMLVIMSYALRGEQATALELLNQTIGSMPNPDRLYERAVQVGRGMVHIYAGQPEQLELALEGLLSEVDLSQPQLSIRAWGPVLRGLVAYDQNRLDFAARQFALVVPLRYLVNRRCYWVALAGLAIIKQLQGQPLEADAFAEAAAAYATEIKSEYWAIPARSLRARLALLRGDQAAAAAIIEQLPAQAVQAVLLDFEIAAFTQAHVRILRATPADLQQAEQLLASAAQALQHFHNHWLRMRLLGLQSILSEAQGRSDQADTLFDELLTLARPARALRVCLDLGTAMADVVRRATRRLPDDPFLQQLLLHFAEPLVAPPSDPIAQPASAEAPAAQPLTQRELAVLQELAARRSIDEIAATLVISPYTVKKHLSHIYEKLGAANRREALARARLLGILPR